MKTKIIYISGAEVFDMADVRAAFDEIRTALNLGPDTVMFGVPVDADSAIVTTVAPASVENEVATPDLTAIETPSPEIVPETTQEPVAEPVNDPEPVVMETPAPKKRGRARKTAPKDEVVAADAETPVAAEQSAPETPAVENTAPVPILSVLAAKSAQDDIDEQVADVDDADEDVVEPDSEIVDAVEYDVETLTEETVEETVTEITDLPESDTEDKVIEEVALADMITDDAPVDAGEKTLEELLASMAPLREDKIDDGAASDMDDTPDTDDDFAADPIGNADATLEKLAAEFAQNEDKIVANTKAVGRGKIGKLKNILPFKKAKRDDNGLMGDLFGWAGIAANDDDFSIPGFFTTAAQKD